MQTIVLASRSPRRHELLNMAEIPHEILTADCEEDTECRDPGELVEQLSLRKAGSTAEMLRGEKRIVIGADTIVCHNGNILGKPADQEDAFRTLKALSGQTHSVFTGVTVIDALTGKTETFHEETRVTFFPIPDDEIRAYIETGDPMDKAGSYGIQGRGAFLVRFVEGDYFTVVGLPLARLIRTLKESFGYPYPSCERKEESVR